MALPTFELMKSLVEELSAKNRALEEENKTLKCTNVKLTQELEIERLSNGMKSINNVQTEVEEVNRSPEHGRKVQSASDVDMNNTQQIPRTATTSTDSSVSERWETHEKSSRMSDSVLSMSSEGANSPLNEIPVKEEHVHDFSQDNLQAETPSMEEDTEEIDIKEEDVAYGQPKSKSDCDNSIHDAPLLDLDPSGDFGTEVGTESALDLSSSHLTTNALCKEIVKPHPAVSSQNVGVRKQPYLTTRTTEIHKCENCSAAFETQFKLREHNKTHTGEKSSRTPQVDDMGLPATKRSIEEKEKVNPTGQPKKKRKVGTMTEAFSNKNMLGEGEGVNPPCVVERNPLKIEKILDRLFSYLKGSDLKTCRLVCKKWNAVALPFIGDTFEVAILSDESSGNLDPSTCRISDFVELIESNTLGIPFSKFMVGPFDPTVGIGQKFLQLCGKTAKKYDFWGTEEVHAVENMAVFLRSSPMLESIRIPRSFSSKHGVKAVKLFSGSEIPELNNLRTLDMGIENSEKDRLICPTFYEEILSVAKNISTLFTYDYHSDGIRSLEVLKIVENLGRESSLETLCLIWVKRKHLEVLRKMFVKPIGLMLKHLRILWCQSPHDSFCFELIELMKESLISLHVRNYGPFSRKFPRMPKLQLLELEIIKMSDLQHENIALLGELSHNFPSLQHLVLGILVDVFSIGIESCPTIKSLQIQNFSNINGQAFEDIINICSNLTELEVDVSEDGPQFLRLIWTQLQRLERLNIYGRLPSENNLDSMFTGILLDKGKRTVISRKLNGLKTVTQEVRRRRILNLIDEHRTLPSIGNLTSLRELTLNVTGRRGPLSHVTDLTGYLGLYSMKSLRSLNISLCKFSKSCSKSLVQDLGLVSWVFQSNAQTDIIPPQWNPEIQREFPSSRFSFNYTI